jgi:hypothetical protein
MVDSANSVASGPQQPTAKPGFFVSQGSLSWLITHHLRRLHACVVHWTGTGTSHAGFSPDSWLSPVPSDRGRSIDARREAAPSSAKSCDGIADGGAHCRAAGVSGVLDDLQLGIGPRLGKFPGGQQRPR